METPPTHIAFAGSRQIAAGSLTDVLPVLKKRFDADRSDLVLVFETETGRQVEFDLRGTLEQVLERATPAPSKGPGRPRLGVSSREISLLPRHWDWLDEQPSGASAALRRLVEQAIKHEPGKERARRIRAALSRFLTSMAGSARLRGGVPCPVRRRQRAPGGAGREVAQGHPRLHGRAGVRGGPGRALTAPAWRAATVPLVGRGFRGIIRACRIGLDFCLACSRSPPP